MHFLQVCFGNNDAMDPAILDAIAAFMDSNKVSYQWKKVRSHCIRCISLYALVTAQLIYILVALQGDIFALNNR